MSRVGLYTWPDGTRYEGEWREHTRDGFGVHTYADGTRYEVRFSRLRLLWQDSEHSMCSTCQGEFQKGLMHGADRSSRSCLTRPFGNGFGRLSGFGIFTSPADGRRYEGGWQHDAPSGFGVEVRTHEDGGSR